MLRRVVAGGGVRQRLSLMARSRVVRRMKANRLAMVGLAFIMLLVFVAVFDHIIAPHDPKAIDILRGNEGSSGRHLLGTDSLGRDTLSRLIDGTRVMLLAALQGLGVATVIGIPLGLLAGYVGGTVDAMLSRVADAFLAMPSLVFAMAIVGVLGPGLTNAMIAAGVTLSPRYFRIARAAAGSMTKEPFIEAARADGCSRIRLLWRHVLPNSRGPLLVEATLGVGFVISLEASLSFLGLGVQPPQATYGGMIRDAFKLIETHSFQIVPPTVAIVLTIGAFFLVGDGLRDAFGRSTGADVQ